MSEGRKKQKQNPSYKGKGSEIVLVGRQPTSPPALWRVTAERRTRVCFCPLTPAVVVIHGMTALDFAERPAEDYGEFRALKSEQFPQPFGLGPADRNFRLLLVVHAQLVGTFEPGHDFLNAEIGRAHV